MRGAVAAASLAMPPERPAGFAGGAVSDAAATFLSTLDR
jgi:hypothetical protein